MSLGDAYNEAKLDATASNGINSIEKLLKANGLTPEDVGKISKVSLSNNPDDTKIILSPKWGEGPAWQPVQQAAPTVVTPKVRTPSLISSDWKVAVALPDPQIGYRRYEDGTLDPFHDEDAMDVALQIVGLDHGHPLAQVINLGDFLDLPMYGTYEQETNFAHTAQLAKIVADARYFHDVAVDIDHFPPGQIVECRPPENGFFAAGVHGDIAADTGRAGRSGIDSKNKTSGAGGFCNTISDDTGAGSDGGVRLVAAG